jgi:prophage endopeptidase
MTFILLYWKYIAAALIVAALVGYYNVHVHGLIKAAEVKAVTENNQSWQAAEKKAIKASEEAARATEQAHAKALDIVKTNYAKETANAKTQRDKDVAAAHSGALRLRDNAASSGVCNDSKAATTTGGSDAPKGADLSPAAAEFLLALADDADAVVRQLSACQQIINSDRKELQ